MTRVIVTKSLLDGLADSVAAKTGESAPLTIAEMADAVDGITVPAGSISITQNDTYDVTGFASAVVSVPTPPPTLQTVAKSYTPTESQQTETITPSAGYDGIGEVDVTVGAVSSTYVGSGIAKRTGSDLTASGATVTVPSGYYASQASKAVSSGSATAPATISGTAATVSTGTNTLTLTKTVSVTPTVTAGYVSSGTAGNASVSLTANVTTQAAQTIYPSASQQTIASGRYLTGTQVFAPVTTANLTAANIKQGVTVTVGDASDPDRVASVTGTYSGGGGGGKNIQVNNGSASVHTNGYTATGHKLTVAVTGTYTVSWTAWRSSSSGTMGTNLHRNSTTGTNQQTWTNTYGQHIVLTNQSLTAGDVLELYATSGSTSRYCWVAGLTIEQA